MSQLQSLSSVHCQLLSTWYKISTWQDLHMWLLLAGVTVKVLFDLQAIHHCQRSFLQDWYLSTASPVSLTLQSLPVNHYMRLVTTEWVQVYSCAKINRWTNKFMSALRTVSFHQLWCIFSLQLYWRSGVSDFSEAHRSLLHYISLSWTNFVCASLPFVSASRMSIWTYSGTVSPPARWVYFSSVLEGIISTLNDILHILNISFIHLVMNGVKF